MPLLLRVLIESRASALNESLFETIISTSFAFYLEERGFSATPFLEPAYVVMVAAGRLNEQNFMPLRRLVVAGVRTCSVIDKLPSV